MRPGTESRGILIETIEISKMKCEPQKTRHIIDWMKGIHNIEFSIDISNCLYYASLLLTCTMAPGDKAPNCDNLYASLCFSIKWYLGKHKHYEVKSNYTILKSIIIVSNFLIFAVLSVYCVYKIISLGWSLLEGIKYFITKGAPQFSLLNKWSSGKSINQAFLNLSPYE